MRQGDQWKNNDRSDTNYINVFKKPVHAGDKFIIMGKDFSSRDNCSY